MGVGAVILAFLVGLFAMLSDLLAGNRRLLEELLAPHTAIVDWPHKDDVQREMRRLIKKQLKAASYPAARIDPVAESVVDLLKRRGAT